MLDLTVDKIVKVFELDLTGAPAPELTGAKWAKCSNESRMERTSSVEASIPSLDDSRLDGSVREDKINDYVRDFERSADRLKSCFKKDRATPEDAEKVLKHAAAIGRFMRASRLSSEAERDWRLLERDLSRLGALYRIAAKW